MSDVLYEWKATDTKTGYAVNGFYRAQDATDRGEWSDINQAAFDFIAIAQMDMTSGGVRNMITDRQRAAAAATQPDGSSDVR